MPDIDSILAAAPVIPVLVIDRVEDSVPIARALVAGGLPVLEVTLRTPAALESIREMAKVEGAIVGAGTILNERQWDEALAAGIQFGVSPGLTRELGKAARDSTVPLLPGVATASEIMHALDLGFTRLKFFPAMASGGLPALRAFASVFGGVRFCPTGGITEESAPEWLAQESVACVGGSWLVPSGQPLDLSGIEARARRAASLQSTR